MRPPQDGLLAVYFFSRSVLAPSLQITCKKALATVHQFSCRNGCTAYRPNNKLDGTCNRNDEWCLFLAEINIRNSVDHAGKCTPNARKHSIRFGQQRQILCLKRHAASHRSSETDRDSGKGGFDSTSERLPVMSLALLLQGRNQISSLGPISVPVQVLLESAAGRVVPESAQVGMKESNVEIKIRRGEGIIVCNFIQDLQVVFDGHIIVVFAETGGLISTIT